MTNEFAKSRLSVAGMGISEDARKTMNAAIDAFSDWRDEMAESAEKNSKAVFDQMASAAKAFGWPTEFVELSRQQMQNASKMQLQLMDQVMDTWEQQIKNPGSMPKLPEAWTNPMKNMPGASMMFPGMPGMGAIPGMSGLNGMPGNPFQFWMQAAEMWQKAWQQGMQSWMEAQSNMNKPR